MVEKNVLLSNIEDVKDFCNIVSGYAFDTELASGKYIVNAKSIMGIFSLDLTCPLKMVAHCEENDPMIGEVEKYFFTEEK